MRLINSLISFHLRQTCPDSKARVGELNTPHGVVATPIFLPVGSQGTVKTLIPEELRDIGIPMILANTYHLYLRPSIDVIEKMGGLHKFMAWDRAILTDSGGYQIFSLARNGAVFTGQGRHNIRNAAYRQVEQPVDPDCDCYTCGTFSTAYLHHLFSCNELLAYRLATIHNLNFINNLMGKARSAILNGTFSSFQDSFLAGYKTANEQIRLNQKQKWLKSQNISE